MRNSMFVSNIMAMVEFAIRSMTDTETVHVIVVDGVLSIIHLGMIRMVFEIMQMSGRMSQNCHMYLGISVDAESMGVVGHVLCHGMTP